MRLVHIVPTIIEQASGGNYAAIRLCEALTSEGEELTLASLDWGPMEAPPSFSKTFPLSLGPRRLGPSATMRRWLTTQGVDRAVDLFHNHSLWMMPNVYPGIVAKRYSIPLVVAPHGTLSAWAMQSGSAIKKVFWPLVQRPALAAVTCFHATAVSEYEDIRRLGFLQPVAVLPNGVDIPASAPKEPDDTRTLLFLGRIHPVKGLDLLLPAWRAVQERFPEWRLRIIGPDNGRYLARMQRLATELRLARIEFTGPLFGPQKAQAYRQADLFVLPTYSENFGIAVAEALAAGVPAIVTKGAPWSGLVTNDCGWWIDIGVDALVACLELALSQPPRELAAMGLRGREWMAADFSWGQIGRKMVATYDWIGKGGSKPDWVIES